MKRKKALLLMFLAISASLFPLASFLIRKASCVLQDPVVNVDPSTAYVGQDVFVEATIENSG